MEQVQGYTTVGDTCGWDAEVGPQVTPLTTRRGHGVLTQRRRRWGPPSDDSRRHRAAAVVRGRRLAALQPLRRHRPLTAVPVVPAAPDVVFQVGAQAR